METLTELIGRKGEILVRLGAARTELERQSARLARLLEECRTNKEARAQGRPAPAANTRFFATDRVRLGDVEVVVPRQSVRDSRGTRRLTPTEWQLLVFLLSNPDSIHSRSELAAGAWGSGYDGRDTEVEVYISRLRRKLGAAAPLLETVRGQGYRFVLWGEAGRDDGLASPARATA
jgi:DNA-binding response OmpR family regulator